LFSIVVPLALEVEKADLDRLLFAARSANIPRSPSSAKLYMTMFGVWLTTRRNYPSRSRHQVFAHAHLGERWIADGGAYNKAA
jgi:hypothetical protein